MKIDESAKIHANALIDGNCIIGARTKVWAFAHIVGDAVIGEDCNVCDHTFIENGVVVGNRVTIKCGVFLWSGVVIEDDVFLGPNATFTNDRFPRSKVRPQQWLQTKVCRWASIGAGAVILPGVVIGEGAMVAAGAVVTKNVAPWSLVVGNPARFVRDISPQERAERT